MRFFEEWVGTRLNGEFGMPNLFDKLNRSTANDFQTLNGGPYKDEGMHLLCSSSRAVFVIGDQVGVHAHRAQNNWAFLSN